MSNGTLKATLTIWRSSENEWSGYIECKEKRGGTYYIYDYKNKKKLISALKKAAEKLGWELVKDEYEN